MTPALATVLFVTFIATLFWRDLRQPRQRISWAPFAWMFFAGSRFASAWLNLRTPGGVEAYAEGSPVDRAVFFGLIVWGGVVLARRDVNWRSLLIQNKWLVVYLLYCAFSIVWTDEPVVLAKRWVKDLGNPIMALVLLTERQPAQAITLTVLRLGYLLLPLSVLFIRYIPELGRGYSAGGGMMYTGAADQKNTLGLLCLIVGTCYVWMWLFKRDLLGRHDVAIAGMAGWLLYMSDSKTSLAVFLIAAAILIVATRPTVASRPGRIIPVTVGSALACAALDSLFQLQDHVLQWLGRDPTLTNRTRLWEVVSGLQTNAILGTGFMSFWGGERMATVWATLGPGINQAHNGYLEQYVNLGYVGVAFILAIAGSALLNVRRQMSVDYPVALLRLCFIATTMIYNYTEASFYGINNMWVLFLAASVHADGLRRQTAAPPVSLHDRRAAFRRAPPALAAPSTARLNTWGDRRRRIARRPCNRVSLACHSSG